MNQTTTKDATQTTETPISSAKKDMVKGIAAGYACAWVGHFFFEKNKPASFKFPLKSFVSDFRMYSDVLRGNLSLRDRKFDKAR